MFRNSFNRYPSAGDRGFTLVEALVAMAIMAAVGIAVSFGFKMQRGVQDSATLRSTALSVKTILLGPLSCSDTMFPDGVAEACDNLAMPTSACDETGLDAGGLRWLDLKRGNGTVYFPGAPTRRGQLETRICCPGGVLRAEWRLLKGDGNSPKVDPLNGNLTYDWQPLFRVAPPCSSVAAAGVNRQVAEGSLNPTIFQCPGYFPEQVEKWFQYATISEGFAKCPTGTKLIGGGVRCPFVPFQGVVASRPYRPLATDQIRWAETTDTWFASCCGLPLVTYDKAVYALCE